MIANLSRNLRGFAFIRCATSLLSALLLFAVAVSSANAAETAPKWNDKPVVAYAQLAPLSRVQRDLAFLSEGAGQTATTAIRDIFSELAAGVDSARPAGMALLIDETFVPMIFVPLKDEERLFAALHSRFGWEFNRGEDGLYRGLTVKAVARVSGSWLYVTGPDHRERLAMLPKDPSELFAGSDPGILAQVSVLADKIPDELRGAFADYIGGLFDGDDKDRGVVSAIVVHALRHVVTESQSWQVELQCFRPLEQFHITTRITPVAGSELEGWISAAEQRPVLMEHLATADSTVAFVISAGLEAESLELVTQKWQALDAAARAKLPSARSNNVLERRAAQLGTTALDAVSVALAKGEFDAGLVVQKQGNETVFLAGSTLDGSRKINEAAVSVFEMLGQVPEFRALQWATNANGDITLHEFQVPADEKTRNWFGEAVHLTAGFGPDRVYAAAGGASAMEKLSQAIDRSREDAPSRGGIMHVVLRMAPFLAFLDQAQGSNEAANANVHEYAERISHYRKNDVLEFNLTAAERTMEGRLRIDMGVVRMLASSIPQVGKPAAPEISPPTSPPATGASNLALRLAPNTRFQIQFDANSTVTTKIDDVERVDQGQYSTIYDFHVLESRPDGAVRLEASLARATIKKTGPDGASSFDSDAKDAPEKMTPEMVLYAAMVNEPFQMTVAADGTLDEFGGLAEAVERMVDDKLQPPANERAQAKAFIEQSFNANALHDSLGRAFEFYPGKTVAEDDRWTRTSENFSGINFLLDSRYQLKSLAEREAVISIRSQIREKESAPAAPIAWTVLGTQTGTIKVDPRNGRLLSAEYELKTDAEATLKLDGKTVLRPVVGVVKMVIGTPRLTPGKESPSIAPRAEGSGERSDPSSGAAGSRHRRKPQATSTVGSPNTLSPEEIAAGWKLLFDGKSLDGWRASESPETFRVEDGAIVGHGPRSHLYYAGPTENAEFTNFELVAEVKTFPGANSGIYLHSTWQNEGWPAKGYEVQINNSDRPEAPSSAASSRSGSLWGIIDVVQSAVPDEQWFKVRILVKGKRIVTEVNDRVVVDYTEPVLVVRPERLAGKALSSGTFALQAADPNTRVHFRSIKVRPLSELSTIPAQDSLQTPFDRDALAGKKFRMFWHMNGERGVVSEVKLQADGSIGGSKSDKEAFWQIDRSGNLLFFGRDRTLSTTFNQKLFHDGRWFLSGPFHFDRNVAHSLEEAPALPSVEDDDTLNKVIRPWSKQRIVGLNQGESYRFELADGTARVVRVEQIKEVRDSVLGFVRKADVRVSVDGQLTDLECAPYVMPIETAGLRIQADITSGMLPNLPKQVSLSLWDANDPIVDTEAFVFPLQDYRLFSHDMQAYNEVVWLGLHDGDPQGVTERHSYGMDIAGFENNVNVLAVADGVVLDLFPKTTDPYAVLMKSSNGVVWEYGHMNSILPEIREGVAVRRGQPIGILGKRGGSGNFSHLHLGLHPSPAHRTAVIRTQRLNFFPWILTAYRAKNPNSLFAIAGGHQVIRVGETCTFNAARSLAFDSTIASYSWRFHDGETIEGAQVRKTYNRPGTYVAELRIEDDRGNADIGFCQVKVFPQGTSVRGIPTIFMTHSPTAYIPAGRSVRFRCWLQADSDAPIQLDFGDSTKPQNYTSYSEMVHAFETPGLYVVTASATVDGMPITHKQTVLVTAGE